ncbi:MAG: hypothetical protein KDI13_05870 [Alphaproteobacteria bacterium]|nr:hypothetical protein [Alphaproteobacteria bacterium]
MAMNNAIRFGLLCAIGLISLPMEAQAAKNVYSPYVEKGELEIESKSTYDFDDNSDVDGAWQQKLGVGYGFTNRWFSEIYGEIEHDGESGANTNFSAIEWENRFQLTEQGQYWLDLGALAEVEYNTQDGPHKVEGKVLLAKDTGPLTHLANIGMEHEFGPHSGDDTEFSLSWSSRYRYSPEFEPGFEIYNEFGSLSDGSDFDDEEHQVGPVAYGTIGPISYDVGYLFGVSDGAPDGALKLNLEYEMRF